MKILLITGLLTLCIAIFANASLRDEPQCYSRFDYEFKVVQKLFMLENAYNDQLEIIKALRSEINSMKQSGQEHSEAIKDMTAVLQDANNRNKVVTPTVDGLQNRGEIVAFSACLGYQLSNIQDRQIIIFNQVILNEASGYNQNTGIFLCPRNGIYLFTFYIGIRGSKQFFVRLMVNNNPRLEAAAEGRHSIQDVQGGNSIMIMLSKGDKVWIQQYFGDQLAMISGSRLTSFSGVLLFPQD